MENTSSLVSKVKQPKPSILAKNEGKRVFNFPRVGVLNTPYVSTLPVMDEYTRKRRENPKIVYREVFKKLKFFNLDNILSSAIAVLGGISVISLIRSFMKK